MKLKNLSLEPRALLAELVGTFILATAAVTTGGSPLYVGFVLIVLVLALGAISGAHLNPAVTFGLWSIRKLEAVKLPFYWAAQLLGGLLALLTIQSLAGSNFSLSLASFNSFDGSIVSIELLGTAIFTFAIAAAVHRGLSESVKSITIGLGLLAGLATGVGLLGQAIQAADTPADANAAAPRITKIDGVALNPAIALAATEKPEQSSMGGMFGQEEEPKKTSQPASRFTWETTVGALAGGAIGMHLYMLLAGVNPSAKQPETVATKVTKVVKKIKKKK